MPLFLLTIAEISNALADFYILIYKHLFCATCNIYRNYRFNHAEEYEDDEEKAVESPDDFHVPPLKTFDDNPRKMSTVVQGNFSLLSKLEFETFIAILFQFIFWWENFSFLMNKKWNRVDIS